MKLVRLSPVTVCLFILRDQEDTVMLLSICSFQFCNFALYRQLYIFVFAEDDRT